MEADTEKPGVLCMAACKSIRDCDTALRDPAVRAEDDCVTGPAEGALADIAKFLWATAARPNEVKPVLIDPLTSGPALPWYQACQERYLVPPGPPTAAAASSSFSERGIATSLTTLVVSLTAQSTAADDALRAKQQTRGFGAVSVHSKLMVNSVTEPDASTGLARTEPVKSY
jgi:hypothetical protein